MKVNPLADELHSKRIEEYQMQKCLGLEGCELVMHTWITQDSVMLRQQRELLFLSPNEGVCHAD